MIYRLPIILAAVAIPTVAPAQTHELDRDRDRVYQAERDFDRAQRYGEGRHVRQARDDLLDARSEYRADWLDYRARNRATYARGSWRAPFRYERLATGNIVRRNYFEPRYHISDYRRYRLPAPPRSARWVRHYDDVVLIYVPTGRVLDVIHDFFL